MRPRIFLALVLLVFVSGACASAPPVAPKAPTVAPDRQMSWILRLANERILRVPVRAPVTVAPPPAETRRKSKALPPPPPEVTPDLTALAADADRGMRRRSALAIGRVGLPEGSAALQLLLADADADVRQMAAFGLGL